MFGLSWVILDYETEIIHNSWFASSISKAWKGPTLYDQTLTSNCLCLVWRQLITGLWTWERVKKKDSWREIIFSLDYLARTAKMKAFTHLSLLALLFLISGKEHLKFLNSFNHVCCLWDRISRLKLNSHGPIRWTILWMKFPLQLGSKTQGISVCDEGR